jgi:hypothetical protein
MENPNTKYYMAAYHLLDLLWSLKIGRDLDGGIITRSTISSYCGRIRAIIEVKKWHGTET